MDIRCSHLMVQSGRNDSCCFGFLLRQKPTRWLQVAQQRLSDFHHCHHTAPNHLGCCGGINQRFGLPVLGFRLQQT